MGTVCDVKKDDERDWAIELFLGSIWEYSKGNFNLFVKNLFKVWLEEWLHMVYRWERVESKRFCEANDEFHFLDEEKPVRKWVHILTNL